MQEQKKKEKEIEESEKKNITPKEDKITKNDKGKKHTPKRN